jgi:integrase
MAVTDAQIRALEVPAKRMQMADGNGLSLDILPSGKKSWLYRYRINGAYGRVTLGRYPDLSLKAARRKRDELAGMVATGHDPARRKRGAKKGLDANTTVEEFGERYYAEQVVTTWKRPFQIKRYLDNEIYPTMGSKTLSAVTALDVQALVYRKRDNGRVASAMHLHGVLKRLFEYAVELQLVTINPAAMVAKRFIGRARRRSRVLTPKEVRLYLRTVYTSNLRRQFKLAVHLLLLTLARKSELILARWEHVNLDTGEWLVPIENAKTAKPHLVYLSTQAVELFQELKALAGDSELVMPGRSSLLKPFSSTALNHAMEGLTFDMDPLTIHDLRRTGATLLTEKGFNRDVIEKALSHEAKGIRAVYIVAEYAEQRRKMLQWWGDYVDSIVTENNVIMGNFGVA